MKKELKIGKFITMICVFFSFVSCSSHYTRKDITKEVIGAFNSFASDTDTVAIQKISLYLTDKRFYTRIEHSAIDVTYHLTIRNRASDTMSVRLSNSTEYAIYRRDTVGWLVDWKIDDLDHFRIAPAQAESIHISNTGFFGGAFFWWEDLFLKKDDYTLDILRILPDVEVYYAGRIVLPAKDLKVIVINYKDDWLSRVMNWFTGAPYSFDMQLR